MKRHLTCLGDDKSGAVAPTVALSLLALIAAGGIAFDYARVASMDTELQNAADQAALAAASQLDGKDQACERAVAAARTLIDNQTRFANDGDGLAVTIADPGVCNGDTTITFNASASVRFYQDKEKTTPSDDDSNARFVLVRVDAREATYALTPVVAAFSSGDLSAMAYAGVGSAVCGAVPFFVCSPDEPVGNTDPYRPVTIAPGTGIAMLEGGSQWGPGNFGFLDQLGKGANGVKEALSADALHAACQQTENVTTETGQMSSFRASFNMRFDIPGTGGSCPDGPCSPSNNVRKDLVRKAGGCSWEENPATEANYLTKRYRPTSATIPLDSSITPEIMGHPRDMCHAIGLTSACPDGRIGDANWDRAAYFRSNHPGLTWATEPGLDANGDGTITRYETYLWEAAQEEETPNSTLAPRETADDDTLSSYSAPLTGSCLAPGIQPSADGPDRRRVTAATVNCRAVHASTGLNGKKVIPVAGFIDIFLVEPSVNRTRCSKKEGASCDDQFTDSNDVYIEVIEDSGAGAQITRRDVPYLIE